MHFINEQTKIEKAQQKGETSQWKNQLSHVMRCDPGENWGLNISYSNIGFMAILPPKGINNSPWCIMLTACILKQ